MEKMKEYLEHILCDDFQTKMCSPNKLIMYDNVTEEYIVVVRRATQDILILVGNIKNSVKEVIQSSSIEDAIDFLDENLEDMFNKLDEMEE